jgi:hypothetical protein
LTDWEGKVKTSTSGRFTYLMGKDRDIDAAPGVQGAVSVDADGQIILGNGGCGDSTLGRAKIHGQAADQTSPATVVANPCRWFDCHATLV